jgi:acyl-CoA thioesterase-1
MWSDTTIAKLKAGGPVTIVALGDSLTYGWQARKGYLDFLGEMLGERYPQASLRIVNQGIPGDTAAGGLRRLGTDVLPHDPDCVLVQFALNDAFEGVRPEAFGRTVREIVETIRADTRAEVVLVTSVWVDDPVFYKLAEAFYRRIEEVADACGLTVARVHEHWKRRVQSGEADHSKLVQLDAIHPTEQGYRLMAEAVSGVFDGGGSGRT